MPILNRQRSCKQRLFVANKAGDFSRNDDFTVAATPLWRFMLMEIQLMNPYTDKL